MYVSLDVVVHVLKIEILYSKDIVGHHFLTKSFI